MSNIDHPDHYNKNGIETIDCIKASMSTNEFKGFLKGNVIKYIARSEYKKNEFEDLKKAQWYLNYLLEHSDEILKTEVIHDRIE